VNIDRACGQSGGPWEFNLRDLLRWCDLLMRDIEPRAPHHDFDQSRVAALAAHYAVMLFSHRMRTADDRAAVARLFADVWPSNSLDAAPKVDISISGCELRIGRVTLSRCGPSAGSVPPTGGGAVNWSSLAQHACATGSAALRQQLTAISTPAMEWLTTCVSMAWMALLVSPDVAAAADAVRLLASVSSTPLVEIPLTPTSDTSDLLGGFEQLDPVRVLQNTALHLHLAASSLCRTLLCVDSALPFPARLQLYEAVAGLLPDVRSFASGAWGSQAAHADAALDQPVAMLRTAHARLVDACAQLGESSARAELNGRLVSCAAMLGDAAALAAAMAGASIGGRFRWVDGLLLSAIEHGHWVLLLQPNLCSAAVVDRLNSLLEPRGFLYVNECGTNEGGPRIVKPHPSFRLFMAVNPADGEVSRAMRNRGIEIFFEDGAVRAATHSPLPPLASPEVRRCCAAVALLTLEAWSVQRMIPNNS